MIIGPNTRIAALVGDPVEHSFSPIIHNTAYQVLGLDAVYLAVRVSKEDLAEAVKGMGSLGFMGANITIPHKERVVSLVDTLTGEARAIGAVNTIGFRRRDGQRQTIGDNTDVTGFLAPLQPHLEHLRGRKMVVLGAGGAARAVLFGVLAALQPSQVSIVARKLERAQALADSFARHAGEAQLSAQTFEMASESAREAALVVNTTPVGMYPHVQDSPLPDSGSFRSSQIVYDLVYNPVRTRLLSEACARGATIINGMEMLIFQAAAAHTMWTGFRMPVDEVREVLLRTVGE